MNPQGKKLNNTTVATPMTAALMSTALKKRMVKKKKTMRRKKRDLRKTKKRMRKKKTQMKIPRRKKNHHLSMKKRTGFALFVIVKIAIKS